MTIFRSLKAIVIAPMLAVIGAAFGWCLAGIIVLADYAVHVAFGMEQGAVSRTVQTVAKVLPFVFGIGGLIAAFWQDAPVASVFGTARWARGKDLIALKAKGSRGLLIGRDPQTKELLHYDGPSHLMTMAPTRTGKGVGTIIPNLLTLNRSVICIDPKGENARIAGRARKQLGPLHVLDPFGVTAQPTSAFNPLGHLDAFDPDIAEDAGTLSDALVFDEPGMSGDAHWNEEAKALITGLIMMVIASEPTNLRHPATLRDYLTRSPKRLCRSPVPYAKQQ